MSDSSFSAAFFANLVAGNLQHVDENMVGTNAAGPAKKINPANFLPQQVIDNNRAREHEQHRRLTEELNRQALLTHPYPDENTSTREALPHKVQVATSPAAPLVTSDDMTDLLKTFKSIDASLKKIAKHITNSK
jgi:hypothetical protein